MRKEQEIVPVAWITKYALSTGVSILRNGYVPHDIASSMLCDSVNSNMMNYHGEEWHRTEEAAKTKVLKMIAAKKKSIAKQIKKYEDFETRIRAGKMMEGK